jgi:hypothetical protein
MKYLFILLVLSLSGCVKPAQFTNLPKSSAEVNFDKLKNLNETKSPFWTNKTSNEYYLELPVTTDSIFQKAVTKSLKINGYKDYHFNKINNSFIARRGIRANEWGTISGIYYKVNEDSIQVYIRSEISQDPTGGWNENRAKKIAIKIHEFVKQNT